MKTHRVTCAIGVYHTQLAKMRFGEIFQVFNLTAGVYFYFYSPY